MRVLLNGKTLDHLDKRVERDLASGGKREVAEGVVRTADQVVAATARAMKILFGAAGGIGALIMVAALIAAGVDEPRDLILLGPLTLILSAGLAALVAFIYRRNLAKARAKAGPQLAQMPTPGTTVRASGEGLAIGGALRPWSAVAIEVMEIGRISSSDGADSYYIESLSLVASGRVVVLYAIALTNGSLILAKIWRILRGVGTAKDVA